MSGLISGGVGVLGFGIGIVAKPVATAAANAIRKFTTGGVKPPPAAVSSNAASCVANSFAPGTGVLMADGSSKPIETLDLGDSVLATDPETGTTAAEPVVRLITGSGEKDLVTLTVVDENGKTASVEATAGHPFWVPEQQQWISAGDLQPGMWLQTASGTWVMLSAVAYEHREQTVYNLTIDTIHTFYVLADDQPLLAHNCGEVAAEGATSAYMNVTNKGSRLTNISTNATSGDVRGTLQANGWMPGLSSDGGAELFTRGGAQYSLREISRSHTGWTLEFTPSGAPKPTLKIRLPEGE